MFFDDLGDAEFVWNGDRLHADVERLAVTVFVDATDGVLAAMGSAILPAPLVGSGLALLATATNVARLLASVFFGVVWQLTGLTTAILVFGVGLLLALVVAQTALAPFAGATERPAPSGTAL